MWDYSPKFTCGFTFYPSLGRQKSRGLVDPGVQCWLVARIKLVCVERALLPALSKASRMFVNMCPFSLNIRRVVNWRTVVSAPH